MSISFDAFGPVAYPLLACSFIALILIIERIIYFVMWKSDGNARQILPLVCSMAHSTTQSERWCKDLNEQNRLVKSIRLLLNHAHKNRELREEMVNHWLAKERNLLFKHFGWLTLLAVISPMLGLLGTVLGIIKVFTAIASHTGPVFPALLADGLGQAMLTTAAGLTIALPVLVTLHGLRIWANSRLTGLAETLNAANLMLEGIDLQEPDAPTNMDANTDGSVQVNPA